MKILFLTKIFPYPPDAGVKIKTYKILQLLVRYHSIHLAAFVDSSETSIHPSKIKIFCKSIKVLSLPIITQYHTGLFLKIARSLISSTPYIISKFSSMEMHRYVNKILKKKKINIIYIDNIHMAQYTPDWYRGKVIYDANEIIHSTYKSFVHEKVSVITKLFITLESVKLERYEKFWLAKFDHIFTISKLDRMNFIKMNIDSSKVSFLPIPYKIKDVYNSYHFPIIYIIASLSWFPNTQGIKWFIDNVFPLVTKRVKNVKLNIVGKNNKQLYIRYSHISSIRFLGYQTNLEKEYKKASVIVVPIFSGGGIRVKILEAMSYGLPIVTTLKGIEGIDVQNRKEVLISNNSYDFAKGVLEIIRNKKLARKLSRNSINFIEKNYNIDMTSKVLKKMFRYEFRKL